MMKPSPDTPAGKTFLGRRGASEVRGKGLLIGVERYVPARPFCEALQTRGILCKETHENVIRFVPPLVIRPEELDWTLEHIEAVLTAWEP
jgi:ornithine--oxo-acid transaminase